MNSSIYNNDMLGKICPLVYSGTDVMGAIHHFLTSGWLHEMELIYGWHCYIGYGRVARSFVGCREELNIILLLNGHSLKIIPNGFIAIPIY